MRQIEPIEKTQFGELITLDHLNCYVTDDDLQSQAEFFYGKARKIINDESIVYVYDSDQGRLIMDGEDYQNWVNSNKSEDFYYTWMANKIGVVLV